MSQRNVGPDKSFVAAADYSAKQYYAMKVSADGTITIASAATDALVGTLLNEPKSGEMGQIAMSGTSKGFAGGTVAIGDKLTADAAGKLIATTTANDSVIGVALESAVASDIFEYAVGLSNY